MADTCQTADCGRRDLVARGLCSACYQRAKYQGRLDETAPNPSQTCERCKEPIPDGRRWGAKFCSVACKDAVQDARKLAAKKAKREAAPAMTQVERRCEWCDQPLIPTARPETRFCSAAHRRNYERAEARANRPPCVTCGGVIPSTLRASATYCSPSCRRKDQVERFARQARHNNLRYTYGLSLEDFNAMAAAQDGRCAICRTDTPGGRGDVFHVDHCHSSGAIRGLLCGRCNNGLGNYLDDPALLRAAADYLERHALT